MSYPHHPNKNPEVVKREETGKRLDGRNSGGFKEWPLVQWQGGDYNHPLRSAPVFSELHKSILNRPFCAELHIKKPRVIIGVMFHFDHCQFKAVENTSSSPASRRTARFPVVSGDTRRTRRALLTAAVVAAAAENPISSTISTDVTSPETAIHDTTGRHRHSPPRLLPFLFLSVLSISSPVVADVS